jgi:filamentous hemagglutinin
MGTFRKNTYSARTPTGPSTLYRIYGGSAGELRAHWTRIKADPARPSILDNVLYTTWGNVATKGVEMRVPLGVIRYEGVAPKRGGLAGSRQPGGDNTPY